MKVLRTPDDRFAGLAGFEFEPHYAEVAGIRVHYIDEGSPDAPPILLLHGEPTWSYLYRNIIPPLLGAGYRAIAPDLIGFGRSDKPVVREEHSFNNHVSWMSQFVREIGLEGATIVMHDWGGLIGLRLLADEGDRFARAVACNTFLPTGDMPMPDAFLRWQRYSQETVEFSVGTIVSRACIRDLSIDEKAAYDAPFPADTFKAGPRIFPALVPTTPDDPAAEANRAAWEVLQRWDKPFLTVFGDADPITKGADRFMQQMIPGARGQDHRVIADAGHFLQEDAPQALAEAIIRFVSANRR